MRARRILAATGVLVVCLLIVDVVGNVRHRQLVATLTGADSPAVLRLLGKPDRVDSAAEFGSLQKGMREEGLPLYWQHIPATGPVWHFNRTSTLRLTLLFDQTGHVRRIVTTDWPSLPGRPAR